MQDWLHDVSAIICYLRGLISYNLSPRYREHMPIIFIRGGRVAIFVKRGSFHFMQIMINPEPDLSQGKISNEGPIDSEMGISENQAPNNEEETV